MTDLSTLTTLRVGGPARSYVEADTEAEFVSAISEADAAGVPVLVLGGGSNLLVADAGFDGVVVRDTRNEVTVQDDGFCGGVSVTATAGVPWDQLVARSVADEWVGLEALSGIPGSVGAAPVQNIGAYGAEVSDTLASVRVWDRDERTIRTLPMIRLQFSYRDSLLKRSVAAPWAPTPRFVVLDATFQMRFGTRSAPVRYRQLAEALGIDLGEWAPTGEVRDAVLGIRRSKGMVLDDTDRDTWSAGSFFTNPILAAADAERLPEDAPRYPAVDGRVKTSAAWLIEHAGFGRGFALPGAPVSLSTKHTLAVTNRGGATASDVLALARHVRDGVRAAYGVELVPEPMLVGASL